MTDDIYAHLKDSYQFAPCGNANNNSILDYYVLELHLRRTPGKYQKGEPQRTLMMGMFILQMKWGSPRCRTLSGRSVSLVPTRDSSVEPDAFPKL
jgi:hypothetical protein